MKSAHAMLWENETRRLKLEAAEREWRKLVAAARSPLWVWGTVVAMYLALFAFLTVHMVGAKLSPFYTLGVFFAFAVGQLWASMKRREKALAEIIAREAPALAEKLRQERVL